MAECAPRPLGGSGINRKRQQTGILYRGVITGRARGLDRHSGIGHIGAKVSIGSIKHFAVFRFAICYTKGELGLIPLRAVRRRLSKISGGVH